MELIMNELPNILILNSTEEEKIKLVSSVKGIATKTAELFVSKIEEFKYFLIECGLDYKLHNKVKELESNHLLFKKNVVLTGTREKCIVDFLKNVGANQCSSVSKNTFIVISKTKDDVSDKIKEAKKLNITIMSLDEFIKNYNV